MSMLTRTWLLASALTTTASMAHHSVPVNFDQSRQITIEGVLTNISWLNPHSHFLVDVTSEDGTTEEWLVEMGSVNEMRRAGFESDLFEVGATISITGWPGRRNRTVFFNEALVPDGTELRCIGAPTGQVSGACAEAGDE